MKVVERFKNDYNFENFQKLIKYEIETLQNVKNENIVEFYNSKIIEKEKYF